MDREDLVHRFIVAYYDRVGVPPTIREIQLGLGMASTATAARYVERLILAERLRRVGGPNQSRCVVPA